MSRVGMRIPLTIGGRDLRDIYQELLLQEAEAKRAAEERARQEELRARRERSRGGTPPAAPDPVISPVVVMPSGTLVGPYTLVEGSTYARTIEKLQAAYQRGECPDQPTITVGGTRVARALTMKETLVARLTDFTTEKDADGSTRSWTDRTRLFNKYISSCTGIAYHAGTTKGKIVPVCTELITIDPRFAEHFLAVPYTSLQGAELDLSKGKYDQRLTKAEVPNHKGWRAAVEDDVAVLTAYRDAVWAILAQRNNGKAPEKAMNFWPRNGVATDEVRALCSSNLGSILDLDGSISLYSGARVLQVTPRRRAP